MVARKPERPELGISSSFLAVMASHVLQSVLKKKKKCELKWGNREIVSAKLSNDQHLED